MILAILTLDKIPYKLSQSISVNVIQILAKNNFFFTVTVTSTFVRNVKQTLPNKVLYVLNVHIGSAE